MKKAMIPLGLFVVLLVFLARGLMLDRNGKVLVENHPDA